MLLDLERLAGGLQHDAEVDVEGRGVGREGSVVGVLDVAAGPLGVVRAHVGGDVLRVEVFQAEEAALQVHLRLRIAVAVDDLQGDDAREAGHLGVVRAEGRRDVDDARSLLRADVVAGDHAEGVAVRAEPGDQLLVAHAHELAALHAAGQDFIGYLLPEQRPDERLGDDVGRGSAGVRVRGADLDVVDVGADAERRVGGEGPGRGGPGEEIEVLLPHHLELHRAGGVLDVAVAAGLVELVRAQARAGGRAVRLDALALVEQALAVDVLEQVPERLDVAVVVGDVGIVHVDPVADALGQAAPLGGIFHHLLAAGAVVVLDGDLGADIFLGDAEFLLDTQLHGQSVGIPAGTAADLESGLRLIAADGVLDGAGHHMVDARHAVGGRRALEENELRSAFAEGQRALESVAFLPALQHFFPHGNQVQAVILFESHIFCLILRLFLVCKFNEFYAFNKNMPIMDIILLLCFIPAIISGLARGFVKQVADLVTLVLAAWAAYYFSNGVAAFLGKYVTWNPSVLKVVSFILIVIVIALVLGVVASLITKALSALQLGFLNKLLGLVLAVIKCALILALLIQLFEGLNDTLHFMRDTYLEDAVVYNALRDFGDKIFPVLKTWIANGVDTAASVAGAAGGNA